jgi:hypothetical protein
MYNTLHFTSCRIRHIFQIFYNCKNLHEHCCENFKVRTIDDRHHYKSFCKFHFNIIYPSKFGVSLMVCFLQVFGIKFVWIYRSSRVSGYPVQVIILHFVMLLTTGGTANSWISEECFDQEIFLRCSTNIRPEPPVPSTRNCILRHGHGAVRRRTDSAGPA